MFGVSGYHLRYFLSDEPQSRPMGFTRLRHYGKVMAYCADDLKPMWDEPYRTGASIYDDTLQRRRLLRVGDVVPAEKFRAKGMIPLQQ